jgi:hypothetical protein
MDGALTVEVECYSGSAYANRPRAIRLGSERLTIETVISEAYTPQGKRFSVRLTDGRIVGLDYLEVHDLWKATGLA